jgi:hypothetical protein
MELLEITKLVTDAFADVGVQCRIVGSVASSRLGAVRATLNVDIIAALELSSLIPWLEHLKPAFYVEEELIRDALETQRSFNLIHLETMLKVDVFPLKNREYDRVAFSRVVLNTLPFMTAEDVLLGKLEWYRAGDEISDRQWSDILGILRASTTFDLEYARHWASEIGVDDLLTRALGESERL